MTPLYPLTFQPVLKRYIWGGRRVGELLGKPIGEGSDYAESWEVADHPQGQSVVANGPLAGTTLHELVTARGEDLLGQHAPQHRFPLIFKLLDAQKDLSLSKSDSFACDWGYITNCWHRDKGQSKVSLPTPPHGNPKLLFRPVFPGKLSHFRARKKSEIDQMNVINIANMAAFTTKDGSEIRELLAHRNSCIQKQSLAEARLPPGASTAPHYHPKTEEIYYVLEGFGRMTIDGETQEVTPGDAIATPPGTIHTITNSGAKTLRFLCCCAPGYEHDDTVLVTSN